MKKTLKKATTLVVLFLLLASTFSVILKIPFTVKATVSERITNGSFEEGAGVVQGWTGTGVINDGATHSGTYALVMNGKWMMSGNLGDIPVADVDSFGFYYICFHYNGGEANYTIIFSDESNVTDTLPESYDWTYVDLVPKLVEGKSVSALYFISPEYIDLLVDDVSLLTDTTERVTNGGFEESFIFSGWTGFGEISDSYAHSGTYSCQLTKTRWMLSSDLGEIPVKRIDSFGFYCISQDWYYRGAVTYTVLYTDGSNSSGYANPSNAWEYVDLIPLLVLGKNVSAIHFVSANMYNPIWIDDVSLMADDTPLGWYENVFTISRSDFLVEAYNNFTFTTHLYVDSLNQTLDTEMHIIEIHEEETWWGSQTVQVYLYVNSSGVYIHAVGGEINEAPLGSGYAEISLNGWHTIYYEYLYYSDPDTEYWSFQVDEAELFSGDTLGYSYGYDRITLGSWGAPDNVSNFTLYYDDVDWTAGTEDFEGSFPGGWTIQGQVGLSASQYYSEWHSLMVPMVGEPLSVTVTPETTTINRNTTQTFEAIVVGGSLPYTYIWYVNGTEQTGETSTTFDFRTENLGFYEIWCNVTDATDTTFKSNVATCTVEAGSLEITISPSSVSINLGEYENVTASVIGGTPPLQYQWYRNQTAVGTNSSRYEINATEWGVGVWTLYCNITDDLSVENKSNTINVYISEGILTATIAPSGTINSYKGLKTDFTSTASGGIPPYTYEWYVNDELKATTSTYRLIHTSATTYNVILKVFDAGINSQWSNTATVQVSNPSASLTPTLKSLRVGQSAVFTCTATAGMGNYVFSWYKSGNLVYEIPSTNNINQYTYTPNSSEESQTYHFEVSVEFNTTFIDPYSVTSNQNTVYVFGVVRRIPAVVATLSTSGVSLPLGHLAQKSAFSAHGYYWQFYYDGYLGAGIGGYYAYGYVRYKYSMDTQMWVQPSGSPLGGANILNNIPFTLPDATPAVYHGWGGGIPFTLYYDRNSDVLYLVYSTGSSTASRSLKMVTATFNETTVDWDWGAPETIATYNSPRLPVCPSMIIANNGNPFVAFLLSRGGPSNILSYHCILAYYNGTSWHLNPTGDPSSWSTAEGPKKLANFESKIYITDFVSWSDVTFFDTATEAVTYSWNVDYQMMIPQDSVIWSLGNYIDDISIVVDAQVNGSFLSDYVLLLHMDIYNGSYWFNDVATHEFPPEAGWRFYPEGIGAPETVTATFSQYLRNYLQTDYEIWYSKIRFWFTSDMAPATCTIDRAYYVLENSFGYTIESVLVNSFTNQTDRGRGWETLHVDGYTEAWSDWTKTGSSPYLSGYNDSSYISSSIINQEDGGYTFENPTSSTGTVYGVYLIVKGSFEMTVGWNVDIYMYDGTSWTKVGELPFDNDYCYITVTSTLNTLVKVQNAQLKFVTKQNVSSTIDYAQLIVEYSNALLPNNWDANGYYPYLNAIDSNNVSITQGPVYITRQDGGDVYNPRPNLISSFQTQCPTHNVRTNNTTYLYSYSPIDVVFQQSSGDNTYLSAFLLARTMETVIPSTDLEAFSNMYHRYDTYYGASGYWNYTLWYMNLTSDINNVFDHKTLGVRAGSDLKYDGVWVNQTDGLSVNTALASSTALDGTPLDFHFYNRSLYVTRFNGRDWNILNFLDENSTILTMNYGEDRCFSYVIQTSSYDVKFFMPFVKVTVKAQTLDGAILTDVGVLMNSELLYTPYTNNYDVIGLYSVTLHPAYLYFTSDDLTYAFIYYIVEASPAVKYNTAHFEIDVSGDIIITIVYAVGVAPLRPSEVTPTPEPEIKYCFPLSFYIIMVLIFFLGVYLYSRRETWKTAIPLIPVILWILLTRPCPPWDLIIAIVLTIIAAVLLINKARQK